MVLPWVFRVVAFFSAPLSLAAAIGLPVVEVGLDPLVLGDGDVSVRSARTAVLPVNLALIDHLVLGTEDVKKVTLDLKIHRAPAEPEGMAEGKTTGAEIDLKADPGLREVALEAGQSVVIAGWKSSWHYHGFVELEGLKLDGETENGGTFTVTLPKKWNGAAAETEHGTFELAGVSKRGEAGGW